MGRTVLAVDDEPLNLDLLEQELGDRGYVVLRAADGPGALAELSRARPDLVLLDFAMPGMNGLEVLELVRRRGDPVPVVVMTAHGSIDLAVRAMKAGADDFITKPFDPDHVALVVGKVLERDRLRREVAILGEEVDSRYRLIVGDSAVTRAAIDIARRAARQPVTVLLMGESGTGKELFARQIHRWSDRRAEPFVVLNCAGFSRELLESELFGHERGAFTGAYQLKRGKVELAGGGTLFLDEVGDMPLDLQSRLLRFLQEREFERVGGTKPMTVDVRVIAATNRDLEADVRDRRFREDLYYRLNVVPIRLPPLRARRDDVPALARFFLERFAREAKTPVPDVAPEAMERLVAYDWPGNVRELANLMERAVVLGDGATITAAAFPERTLAQDSPQPGDGLPDLLYHDAIDAYRRQVIVRALQQAGGNRAAAARALGLQRTYLARLIRTLGIR